MKFLLVLIISISSSYAMSMASVSNETICLDQSVNFHSNTNKIRLITETKSLWIIQSLQGSELRKGCYNLLKGHKQQLLIENKTIISQFYKIIDIKGSSTYRLEQRSII